MEFRKKKRPDFKVALYEVTNEEFGNHTSVRITHRGQVSVSINKGKDRHEFVGQLERSELDAFIHLISETRPCDMVPQNGSSENGESVKITIGTITNECSTLLPMEDQLANDNFARLISSFSNIADQISTGRVSRY